MIAVFVNNKNSFAQYNGGVKSSFVWHNTFCNATTPVLFGGYYGGIESGFSKTNQNCSFTVTGTTPYVGGKNNGFASIALACLAPPTIENIYSGGINDGFAYKETTCEQLTSNSTNYFGGINGGYKQIVLDCPIPLISYPAYFGGKHTGFSNNTISCPPISLSFNSYYGGIKSGSAFLSTFCSFTTTGTVPYVGGKTNGFSFINIGCSQIASLENIYVGSYNDGFAHINTECPPDFSNISVLYYGGKNNGFDAEIQTITCPIFAPLPVELIYFNAECQSNNITLNWGTASQTNNSYFTIEKSTDGISYLVIAQITGAGTTSMLKTYTINDNLENSNSILYYKLSQTDVDGSVNVLKIIDIKCNVNGTEINIYPNPNNGLFLIDNKVSENNYYHIYNPIGQLIQTGNLVIGKNTISIDNLANGIYTLMIDINQNKIYSKKIIIIN